jgi:hypothetical protein
MDTKIGTYCSFYMTVCCQDNRQSSIKDNNYQLFYSHILPPGDGL